MMKKQPKVLSLEEKRRLIRQVYGQREPYKYEWFCIITGKRDDTSTFIWAVLTTPIVVTLSIFYLTGYELRISQILAMYVAFDTFFIRWWMKKALQRKQELEERKRHPQVEEDRMPIIRQKIEELRLMDERMELEQRLAIENKPDCTESSKNYLRLFS